MNAIEIAEAVFALNTKRGDGMEYTAEHDFACDVPLVLDRDEPATDAEIAAAYAAYLGLVAKRIGQLKTLAAWEDNVKMTAESRRIY